MKHLLLTTIAAVLLVGCGGPKDIWEAAQQGNIEAVKQHLAAGADVNMKGDQRRQTPLHDAAASGHMEVAELLITNGANLNAKSVIGETPLDAAVNFKQTEIANLLRKHGGKTAEGFSIE